MCRLIVYDDRLAIECEDVKVLSGFKSTELIGKVIAKAVKGDGSIEELDLEKAKVKIALDGETVGILVEGGHLIKLSFEEFLRLSLSILSARGLPLTNELLEVRPDGSVLAADAEGEMRKLSEEELKVLEALLWHFLVYRKNLIWSENGKDFIADMTRGLGVYFVTEESENFLRDENLARFWLAVFSAISSRGVH